MRRREEPVQPNLVHGGSYGKKAIVIELDTITGKKIKVSNASLMLHLRPVS